MLRPPPELPPESPPEIRRPPPPISPVSASVTPTTMSLEQFEKMKPKFPDVPKEGLELGEGLTLLRNGRVMSKDVSFPLGTLDPVSGQFNKSWQAHGLTALEKPLRFVDLALSGLTVSGIGTREIAKGRAVATGALSDEFQMLNYEYFQGQLSKSEYLEQREDLIKRMSGVVEEYEELPWYAQLAWELPAWIVFGFAGLSSLKGVAALKTAAKAGTIPKPVGIAGRVVLEATTLPTFERVTGAIVRTTVNETYNAVMTASLRRNLRSWATSVGKEIPKEVEDTFIREALANLSPKFMVREAAKTLFKPTKGGFTPTPAGQRAAEEAASNAVRTSPMLLGEWVTPPKPALAVPPTTPESIANKVINKEALTLVEQQFRINNAQAVENILKTRAAPTPTTEPVVTPEVKELEFISDRIRLDYIKAPAEVVQTDDLSAAPSNLLTEDNDFVYVKETPNHIVLTEEWTPASRKGVKDKYGSSTNAVIIENLTPRFKEIGGSANLELVSHTIEKGNSVVVFRKPQPPVTPGATPPAVEGVAPEAPIAEPPAEFVSAVEGAAVAEVSGAPPKPPKDWDKIGGKLYDQFKQQATDPTPSTVPLSDRILRLWPKLEKLTHDELAGLNWLGWQAEVDSAMVRAAPGQAAELYRRTMVDIRKSLNNDSSLITHVDDYLVLRHQLEVLKATGRKYFTIKKGGKTRQYTSKQIGLLFAQMKKELGNIQYARVKEAASHVPAMYNQILRGTQELTTEQIEGLIKKYPWYNPILFAKESVPVNITRKLSPRQVRQLTNLASDKELISPLMSLPSTIARRMQAQAVNEARRSVSELAIYPKNTPLVGGEVKIVAQKPEGAFIDYFDGGKHKYLELGKGAEWLAKDIELLQRQPSSVMIRLVRSLQNLSKMAFTTYNPGFMVWNAAFDGMVSFFSEGIGPWGFGKALLGNIKGMFVDVPGLNEFRSSGGEMMGFFEKGSMEGVGFGEAEKATTGFIGVKKGRLVLRNPDSLKRFINPFELIRELGLAGENAGRRATYEKAIKEGVSPKEAGLRSRRAMVDFSRFSAASKHINDWFIYFNPALQGFYLPGRAIAKDPRSLWRLAAIVAGYVGLTYYNQSYEEYKDVRDSDKVGKLLIMLPSDEYNKYGDKVPHYITLLPFREFAAFTAPVEYMMGRLRAEQPEAYRTLGQEWDYLYPALSPLSMISESGGLVMPTQIASTIQQILQNHDDFRNKPIVDDEMALLPASQQYDQYTNKLSIRIGQALGMSPKKLDFFVSNMFGALGSDALRTIDLAIRAFDKEQVDERIAGLVNDLRGIPTRVPPNQIEIARETFLEGLSVEDRQLVLNMERMPDEQMPFIRSIFQRFFRDYGGQVYQTAKEKALASRTLEDYPPEALEELQKVALENANNLMGGKISKYQYDQNRSRYRAYFSGGRTAEWREAMMEGAVARADVDKFMPEAYRMSEELQAVSAYMEIRQKFIDDAGGVFDSDTWDMIEQQTLAMFQQYYSSEAIQYAISHKDDWIDNLPEPARTVERARALAIEDETWWDAYREPYGKAKPSGGRVRGYSSGGRVRGYSSGGRVRGYSSGSRIRGYSKRR